jgi:hypothetical protein
VARTPSPKIKGLLPIQVADHERFVALGLTDDDLITFDDLLLCGGRRRVREWILTFVRFATRRRDRHGVAGDRATDRGTRERSTDETRQAVLGRGPARVRQPASADALAQLDRALTAVDEGTAGKLLSGTAKGGEPARVVAGPGERLAP